MKEKEKDKAREQLRQIITENQTVYAVLRHVSRSGLYRVISLFVIKNNEPLCIDSLASKILWGYDMRHRGCKAHGVGMDVGFHLVYNLSQQLFNDGYKLRHKWL